MGLGDKLRRLFGAADTPPEKLPGRNEPCWCGSGKKYKRCHMRADQKRQSKALAATCRGPT